MATQTHSSPNAEDISPVLTTPPPAPITKRTVKRTHIKDDPTSKQAIDFQLCDGEMNALFADLSKLIESMHFDWCNDRLAILVDGQSARPLYPSDRSRVVWYKEFSIQLCGGQSHNYTVGINKYITLGYVIDAIELLLQSYMLTTDLERFEKTPLLSLPESLFNICMDDYPSWNEIKWLDFLKSWHQLEPKLEVKFTTKLSPDKVLLIQVNVHKTN